MTDAITREEKLLAGIAIEPITREEMFLAKLAGQNVNTPEPITRKEKLMQRIIDNGISGGGNLFVNLICGDDGSYTLDKTFAEMHDAIVAGRTVQLNDNGSVYNLSWRGDDSLSFTHLLTNGSFTECASYHIDSDNKLEEHYVELVSKS